MALPNSKVQQIKNDASSRAGHNENEDITPYRSGFFYGYLAGAAAEAENSAKTISLIWFALTQSKDTNQAIKLCETALEELVARDNEVNK